MNASTSEAKSALPTPLSAAQLHRMQNVENPVNTGDNTNSLSQRDLGDLPEESAVDARERTATAPTGNTAQLHIPSQGTSHKFFGQQRARKALKHEDITTAKSKAPRTLSFKSHRTTRSEKHKLLKRNKSVDSGHASKEIRPKVAESDVNDFVKVEKVKGDRASLQHAGSLNQGRLIVILQVNEELVITFSFTVRSIQVNHECYKDVCDVYCLANNQSRVRMAKIKCKSRQS